MVPCPTAEGERRRSAEGVHDGGVAAAETRHIEGVKFPGSAVGALSVGVGEVDVS